MSEKKLRPTLQTDPYDNCTMYGPDNEWMCACDHKKMNWYLDRNLAEKLSDNTFKLTFKPEGKGHATESAYFAEKRVNCCVICGTEADLTKHHIVPYCYRMAQRAK